jgi:hypothetical protein
MAAFGFLALAVSSAVAQLYNGYKQRQQTAELERRRETNQLRMLRQQHLDTIERLEIQNDFTEEQNRIAHEQMWERQKDQQRHTAEQNQIAQEQMWGRQKDQQQHTEKMHRKSRRLQHDIERMRWDLGRLAEGYPVRRGPFHLRRHLQLCYPAGFPGNVPPVVLIPPLRDESNKETWANARLHAQYLLGGLYGDELIHIPQGLPDRPFTWPDFDLYRYDLLDVPAIIVSATAAPGGVNIWLGGCHLLPAGQEVWPFAQARPVLSVTNAVLSQEQDKEAPPQFLSPLGKQFAAPVRVAKTSDPQADQRRMLELVSRGVELCVTKMVDTFHLLRQDSYEERFDEAVGRDIAPAEAAQLADGRFDPPIETVKDPGYHLLHRARRSLRAGNTSGATKILLDAFTEIGKRFPQPLSEVRTRAELRAFLDKLVGPNGPPANVLSNVAGQHLRLAAAIIAETAPANDLRAEVSPLLTDLTTRVGNHRAIGDGPLGPPQPGMAHSRRLEQPT